VEDEIKLGSARSGYRARIYTELHLLINPVFDDFGTFKPSAHI
jgi:hypothetical protein